MSLGSVAFDVGLAQKGKPVSRLAVGFADRRANFEIICESDLRDVQVSFDDGAAWSSMTAGPCAGGKASVGFVVPDTVTTATGTATWPEIPAKLRQVYDRGFAEAIPTSFIRGTPGSQSATAGTGPFTFLLTVPLNLVSKFVLQPGVEYDAAQVKVSPSSGCTGGDWVAFAPTIDYDLPNPNNANNLSVKFRDAGDNESSCIDLTITHDTIPPSAVSFALPQVPPTTTAGWVDFNIQAGGDVAQMKISDGPACVGGAWESYATTKTGWPVAIPNSLNFASIQFRDLAGNPSACLSTSFTQDLTPPPPPTVDLLFGSTPSQSSSPVIRVSGLETGDYVRFFRDTTCTDEMASGFATGGAFYANPTYATEGTYVFSSVLRDAAGNTSVCYPSAFSYTYDVTSPTATMSGHPVGTSNVLTWSETFPKTGDLEKISYKIGDAATDCASAAGYSAFIPVPATVPLDVGAMDDGGIRLCARGQDAAGNTQPLASATSASWVKNTSAVVAVLKDLPADPSNATSLGVTVEGTGVTHYKYKLGVAASVDCASPTGYSASWIAVGAKITNSLTSYANVAVKLCVYGKNAIPEEQPIAAATSHVWMRDVQAPVVAGFVPPANGTYFPYEQVSARVSFNEPVKTVSNCVLRHYWGPTARDMTFRSQVDETTLEFVYTLADGDDGAFENGSLANGNCVTDLAGNAANPAIAGASFPGVVSPGVALAVGFEKADLGFPESAGTVQIPVTIPYPISQPITAEYFVDGTAVPGTDYVPPSGTVTIPPGATSANIPISMIDNAAVDGDRSIVLQIRSLTKGVMKSPNVVVIRVRDDEVATGAPKELATGSNYACWVTTDGFVRCLGANSSLQQGSLTAFTNFVSTNKIPISGVKSLSAMQESACALMNDGAVNCWGQSNYGQTGSGLLTNQAVPVPVVENATGAPLTNVVELASTALNTCARLGDGSMRCWGQNNQGQIATGATSTSISKAYDAGLVNVERMFVGFGTNGYVRICALGNLDSNPANGKELACWGYSGSTGNVGNGSTAYVLSPAVLPITNVEELVNSNTSSFVRTADGRLYGWAENNRGQLATGDTTVRPTPVSIFGDGVAALASGGFEGNTLCAIRDADLDLSNGGGVLSCWGYNGTGLVGTGVTGNVLTPYVQPTANVMSVSIGGSHLCYLADPDANPADGGDVWCSGSNNAGQIGDGTTTNKYAPVKVISGGAKSIALSGSLSCALMVDGTVVCWGDGFSASPGPVAGLPADLASLILRPTASVGRVCGKRGNGELHCNDGTGALVGQTPTCLLRPAGMTCDEAIAPGYNPDVTVWSTMWKGVTAGTGRSALNRQCLAVNGEWLCGGDNSSGTLLQKTSESLLGLVKTGLPATGRINISSNAGCELPGGSGTLNCWGAAGYAGLAGNAIQPTPVPAFTDVAKFFLHQSSTAVSGQGMYLTTGGEFRTWTGVARTTIDAGVFDFASNNSYHCYVAANGKAKCKGTNNVGQLGDGSTTNSPSAYVDVFGLSGLDRIWVIDESGSSTGRTCARVASTKRLYCWGGGFGASPASVVTSSVEDVTIVPGEVCARLTGGELKCGSSAANMTTVQTDVAEAWPVWGTGGSKCVLKTNGDVACIGKAPSTFGRLYDRLPRFYP